VWRRFGAAYGVFMLLSLSHGQRDENGGYAVQRVVHRHFRSVVVYCGLRIADGGWRMGGWADGEKALRRADWVLNSTIRDSRPGIRGPQSASAALE
jgi:hypothetical protein